MNRYLFAALLFFASLQLAFGLPAPAQEAPIVSGDTLCVEVKGEPELDKTQMVRSDGRITLDLLGEVTAAGKSIQALTAELTKSFAKFIEDASIEVRITERAKISASIFGDVRNAGLYQIDSGGRVRDLLIAAGGSLSSADLSRALLMRGPQTIKIDLTKAISSAEAPENIILLTGDTLNVPSVGSAGSVCLLGQVRNPGSYPLRSGMKVLDALAMAGGFTEKADLRGVMLNRLGEKSRPLDMQALLDGENLAANQSLEPGDSLTVNIAKSKRFTVLGAVQRPGQYPLEQKTTITDAMAAAGGLAERANLGNAVLIRQIDGKPQQIPLNLKSILAGDASGNQEIRDGDVINITWTKERRGPLRILTDIMPFMWILR